MDHDASRQSSPRLAYQPGVPCDDLHPPTSDLAQWDLLGDGLGDAQLLDFDGPLGYPAIVNASGWEENNSLSLPSGPPDGIVSDAYINNTDATSSLLWGPVLDNPALFGGTDNSFDFSLDTDIGMSEDASFQDTPQLNEIGLTGTSSGPMPAADSDLVNFASFMAPVNLLHDTTHDTNNMRPSPTLAQSEPSAPSAGSSKPTIPSRAAPPRNHLVPILPKSPLEPRKATSELSLSQQSLKARSEAWRSTGSPDRMAAQKRKRKARTSPIPNCDVFPVFEAAQGITTPKLKKVRGPYARNTCLRCQINKTRCSGSFPCEPCLKLWRDNKQKRALKFTACFESEFGDLDYLSFARWPCRRSLPPEQEDAFVNLADYFLETVFKILRVSYELLSLANSTSNTHGIITTDATRGLGTYIQKPVLPIHNLGPNEYLSDFDLTLGSAFYVINSNPQYLTERLGFDAYELWINRFQLNRLFFLKISGRVRELRRGKRGPRDRSTAFMLSVLLMLVEDPTHEATAVFLRDAGEIVLHTKGINSLDDLSIKPNFPYFLLLKHQRNHLKHYIEWLLGNCVDNTKVDNRLRYLANLGTFGYNWCPAENPSLLDLEGQED